MVVFSLRVDAFGRFLFCFVCSDSSIRSLCHCVHRYRGKSSAHPIPRKLQSRASSTLAPPLNGAYHMCSLYLIPWFLLLSRNPVWKTIISGFETPPHGPQVKDLPKRSTLYFLHRNESALSSRPVTFAQAPASRPGRPRLELQPLFVKPCCSDRCAPGPLALWLTPRTLTYPPACLCSSTVSRGHARVGAFSFDPG